MDYVKGCGAHPGLRTSLLWSSRPGGRLASISVCSFRRPRQALRASPSGTRSGTRADYEASLSVLTSQIGRVGSLSRTFPIRSTN